jgi:amino acid transporter
MTPERKRLAIILGVLGAIIIIVIIVLAVTGVFSSGDDEGGG